MDTFNIALSGLNTASLSTALTASNVANANTDGYRAKRLDTEEQAGGGVEAAKVTESQEATAPGGSNVDYATEMVNLMTQSGSYGANLQVAKTQDEMLGSLLDMKG